MSVPSAEAQIDTTNESQGVINNDKFLVVSLATVNTVFIRNGLFFFFIPYPVESHVCRILENVVVRMAQDLDVSMTGASFGTETFQGMLGMR